MNEFELLLFPRTVVGKPMRKDNWDQYLHTNSLQQLYLAFRTLKREGLLNYEFRVSPSYVEQEEAISAVKFRTDVLTPVGPAWTRQQNSHGLASLYPAFKDGRPLTDNEITKVLTNLPQEISEQQVTISIKDVQWDALKEFIANQPAHTTDQDVDEFTSSSYKDLEITGTTVKYRGRIINMQNRQKQALRLLIDNGENITTLDEFSDPFNSVFKPTTNVTSRTVNALIHEMREKLTPAIGYDPIVNDPENGYHLKLN